jgi:DNA-binding response OmpR family regulator
MTRSGRPRILLVDDDPYQEELSQYIADELDADLVSVATGEEGLQRATSESFDLILLDILMPDLSGYEICQRLKANPKTVNVPIIFVTARNREEDILKGYEVLAFDYIAKPYHPRELKARIANALRIKALLDDLSWRVAHYETCLEIARRFDSAPDPEHAMAAIQWTLETVVLRLNLEGAALLDATGSVVARAGEPGEVAAEIPIDGADFGGTLVVWDRRGLDDSDLVRLSGISEQLGRGLERVRLPVPVH